MTIEDSKQCKYCFEIKPMEMFREKEAPTKKWYRYNECRDCYNARFRALYLIGEYRIKRVVRDAKQNAKRRGFDFTITAQDLLDMFDSQGGLCALTGHHMTLGSSSDLELRRYAASPDRIDNERGYTNDNVWLVCQHANSMKSSTDLEEFIEWCRAVAVTHKR